MNDNNDPWKRLVDAAKTSPVEEQAEPNFKISVKPYAKVFSRSS